MKTLSEDLSLEGYSLRRTCFLPEGPPRATAVLLHGHGDFIMRYAEVVTVFQSRGIAVVGTDMPGHGSSSGRRGRIPGFSYVDQVMALNRARCHELAPDAPIGLLGHSCGGLMALRELFRNPEDWDYAWLSSPLVHPEGTRSAIEVWFLLMVSRILPFLSVDTGVGPRECVLEEDKGSEDARLSGDDEENLFHRRITLGWILEICGAARWVREQFAGEFPPLPTLFTQGEDDPVCRADTLRALLEGKTGGHLELTTFPGLRHEPFADTHRTLVLDRISKFLDEEILSPLPHRDTAGGT